jgi:glycosyltransferase involved in cell wall biosynthesis
MHPTIAAVVLAKNEEKMIGDALRSMHFADELLLIDSGSSDRTVQIAESCGARVVTNVQDGAFNIAEQRNFATHECGLTSDWVLHMDADEVVTSELRESILKAVSEAPDDVVGFRLCYKFMFMGKWVRHAMDYPSWVDRLIRRGRVQIVGGVWEHADPAAGRLKEIHEPFLHYSVGNGIERWIETQNRHSTDRAAFYYKSRTTPISVKNLLRRKKGGPRAWKREIEVIASRLIWFTPPMRFLYGYIYRRGFLDGFPGFVLSLMWTVFQSFICFKVLELSREKKDNEPLM